jgi:hypothetical protein
MLKRENLPLACPDETDPNSGTWGAHRHQCRNCLEHYICRYCEPREFCPGLTRWGLCEVCWQRALYWLREKDQAACLKASRSTALVPRLPKVPQQPHN